MINANVDVTVAPSQSMPVIAWVINFLPFVIMALLLDHTYTMAAILFLVAAATDWFDGRLARRWNVTTTLGSFLDTTADKLLVTTTLVGLVAVHRASPWVALIIIAREFTILGLRAAVAAGGVRFDTSMLGKWKATVQSHLLRN